MVHTVQAYGAHCVVVMQTVMPVTVVVVVTQMVTVMRMPVVVGVMHMWKGHGHVVVAEMTHPVTPVRMPSVAARVAAISPHSATALSTNTACRAAFCKVR